MIGNLIIAFTIGFIFDFIYSSVKKSKPNYNQDGTLILEYSKIYNILAKLISVAGFVFIILLFVLKDLDNEGVYTLIGLGMFCMLMGFLINVEIRKYKVIVTNDCLIQEGMFSTRTVNWCDVNSITYNTSSKYLTLSDGTNKVKIHQHMVGIFEVIRAIASSYDEALYAEAFRKMRINLGEVMSSNN